MNLKYNYIDLNEFSIFLTKTIDESEKLKEIVEQINWRYADENKLQLIIKISCLEQRLAELRNKIQRS